MQFNINIFTVVKKYFAGNQRAKCLIKTKENINFNANVHSYNIFVTISNIQNTFFFFLKKTASINYKDSAFLKKISLR